jgi:hypothetical protein
VTCVSPQEIRGSVFARLGERLHRVRRLLIP